MDIQAIGLFWAGISLLLTNARCSMANPTADAGIEKKSYFAVLKHSANQGSCYFLGYYEDAVTQMSAECGEPISLSVARKKQPQNLNIGGIVITMSSLSSRLNLASTGSRDSNPSLFIRKCRKKPKSATPNRFIVFENKIFGFLRDYGEPTLLELPKELKLLEFANYMVFLDISQHTSTGGLMVLEKNENSYIRYIDKDSKFTLVTPSYRNDWKPDDADRSYALNKSLVLFSKLNRPRAMLFGSERFYITEGRLEPNCLRDCPFLFPQLVIGIADERGMLASFQLGTGLGLNPSFSREFKKVYFRSCDINYAFHTVSGAIFDLSKATLDAALSKTLLSTSQAGTSVGYYTHDENGVKSVLAMMKRDGDALSVAPIEAEMMECTFGSIALSFDKSSNYIVVFEADNSFACVLQGGKVFAGPDFAQGTLGKCAVLPEQNTVLKAERIIARIENSNLVTEPSPFRVLVQRTPIERVLDNLLLQCGTSVLHIDAKSCVPKTSDDKNFAASAADGTTHIFNRKTAKILLICDKSGIKAPTVFPDGCKEHSLSQIKLRATEIRTNALTLYDKSNPEVIETLRHAELALSGGPVSAIQALQSAEACIERLSALSLTEISLSAYIVIYITGAAFFTAFVTGILAEISHRHLLS